MNLNFKNSKRIGIIIGIVLFAILAVGVTYAVIAWRTTNYNVTLNSKCLVEANFSKSEDISGEDLLLIESQNIYLNQITIKKGMVLSNFSVWKDTTSDCTIDGYLRIALNVTSLPSAYMENGDSTNALQYALFYYDPEEYPNVNSNDLDGETFNTLTKGYITNTGLMDIYNDTIPDSGEKRNYILAIYLDGNLTHNNANDTNFSASVEASIDQINGNIPKIDPLVTDESWFEYEIVENTKTTYIVTDQSSCESYVSDALHLKSNDAATICSGGEYEGITLESAIVNGDIPSSGFAKAGISENTIVEGQTAKITRYKFATTTYTVTDQSACESYMKSLYLSWNYDDSDATTYAGDVCSGGIDGNGGTLSEIIAYEYIPSSDYSAAGLSNVVITPAPTDVVIPSEIDGYPVTEIGKGNVNERFGGYIDGPFFGIDKDAPVLTSVKVPSSVTTIGEGAFYRNSLTSIIIENENVTIGNCAFGTNPPLSEPFLSNYSCIVPSGDNGGSVWAG